MSETPGGTKRLRLFVGLASGCVALLALLATTSPVAQAIRKGETLSGLILGTDLAEHAPHSDTLMVWLYHPRGGRLDVLSVPRDTRIDLPGYRFRRINEVFAFHFSKSRNVGHAAQEVCKAVGHLFSTAGSPFSPRFFVQLDYDVFRRVIDRLGGVTVSIDEPMDYDDQAGNFHVHLSTGVRSLNGEDALGFVRFRGRSGDRGRILRQMEFVRAVARKFASPMIVWRGPRAVADSMGAVGTNLSLWDGLFLAFELRRLTAERVNTLLLPGRPKGMIWEMDRERTAFVLSRLTGKPSGVGGSEEAIPEEEAASLPSRSESEGPSPVAAAPRPVTVKVWNASGRVGLAVAVSRRLRAAGFDVVEWGNYNDRQNKSRVVDRSGHFERAQSVATALGLNSLYSDVDPSLRTDVDVMLGEDYGSAEDR